jgi:hypothetical protein
MPWVKDGRTVDPTASISAGARAKRMGVLEEAWEEA